MVAVFILGMAMIPIAGMVSRDSSVAVEMGMHGFAQEIARNVLNACLDEIPFEMLLTGSPGQISGSFPNATALADRLFPNGGTVDANRLCDGYFVDRRGFRYQVTMEVRDITAQSFSAFKNPDGFPGRFLQTTPAPNMAERATLAETGGVPSFFNDLSPSACGVVSVYQDPDWARTVVTKQAADFSLAASPVFLKTLILRVRWSYLEPNVPQSAKRPGVLWVVTHKGRLQIP
jgi:hypothetical protein